MSVRVVDRGANDLIQRLRQSAAVKVGVIGPKAEAPHAGAGLTNVEVASAHEFGIGVPRRSFIADYVDENQSVIAERLRKVAASVAEGEDFRQAVERFGLQIVGEIQERIVAGIEPPNSPSTIAKKGSSTPLINTGQLKASITHEVELGASTTGGGGG